MSVRKRVLPRTGEVRWQVDYRDRGGVRRARQFAKKSAAVQYETKVRGELVAGTHVADSASITVSEAADIWLAACEANGLEAATIYGYQNAVRLHIKPLIGHVKLPRLTAPAAQDFVERLVAKGMSRMMVRRVSTLLKNLVSESVRRGLAAVNPAREVRLPGTSRDDEVVEFPSREEIKTLLDKAEGPMRVFVHTALFTGMRASELRGLTWDDIDLKDGLIHVRQRADRFNNLGKPKSKAGRRSIPVGPHVVSLLREWKLICPRKDKGAKGNDDPGVLYLVFPDPQGDIEDHTSLYRRFGYLQLACGITLPQLDKDGASLLDKKGRPQVRPKYGLHAMRHACASFLIAEGWQPKRVQAFLGHASIGMTLNVYAHLFKDSEADQKAVTRLEGVLLGA